MGYKLIKFWRHWARGTWNRCWEILVISSVGLRVSLVGESGCNATAPSFPSFSHLSGHPNGQLVVVVTFLVVTVQHVDMATAFATELNTARTEEEERDHCTNLSHKLIMNSTPRIWLSRLQWRTSSASTSTRMGWSAWKRLWGERKATTLKKDSSKLIWTMMVLSGHQSLISPLIDPHRFFFWTMTSGALLTWAWM